MVWSPSVWDGAAVAPHSEADRVRSGRGPRPVGALWREPTLWVLAAAVFAAITTEVLPVGLLPQISARLGVDESRSGLLVSATPSWSRSVPSSSRPWWPGGRDDRCWVACSPGTP